MRLFGAPSPSFRGEGKRRELRANPRARQSNRGQRTIASALSAVAPAEQSESQDPSSQRHRWCTELIPVCAGTSGNRAYELDPRRDGKSQLYWLLRESVIPTP